ncbi:MAG: DUF3048 domain-containing protein [Trueperaceae bacterium]|nr:DUF3048 domain-containing protein [Trueperaceae bacterium]
MNTSWQDKDKRRAFLLSILIHTLALLALLWAWNRPDVVPLESFLVIDVGPPAFSETTTNAAAADAPAPQAAEPLVAAPEIGEPVAQTPPPSTPVPQEAPAEATEVAEPSPTPEVAETPAPEPQAAEIPTPEPQAEASPPPLETPVEVAEPSPPPPQEVPAPQVVETPADATPETELTTTLPEIDEVELAPQPEAQALPIPQPATDVSISSARTITTDIRVEVNQPQAVPMPTIETQIQEAQAVPSPTVSAAVQTPEAVPQPQVSSNVSTAQTIPQPDASSAVSTAQSVPQPQVQASVTTAATVPEPNVQTSVTASSAVPQPNVQASVSAATTVPAPSVQSSVTSAQNVSVNASAQVAPRQVVPIPLPSAVVTAVDPDAQPGPASESIDNAVDASVATPGQATNRSPGGNADRSGQSSDQTGASPENLGLAAGPEGSEDPTGAPFARVPYRENRDRPLTVMLDNLRGYPQMGLLEASYIIEMPVEGGITRLMTVYDRIDPARVGPVRSTREYFLDVNTGFNGVMVHDGGSPGALAAIERNNIPTINAFFSSTEVFQRSNDRGAPYNLYSQGTVLRQELARRNQNQTRIVSGTTFRPEETETDAEGLTVTFSADYSSGFRYINDLNLYRWVRNGSDASDAAGQAVYVDAVLLANIEAVPVPGDSEGRLYIPMRGGTATLYLNGKAIKGRWDIGNGIRFTSSLGEVIDLAPFKTWVAYAPQNASVSSQ